MKRALAMAGLGADNAPKTIAESVYRRLRSDIIWGALPPGSSLRSDGLRKRYDAGISPLREALSRLASERLVISSGQRGFRVTPIDTEQVADIMATRRVIECAALTRSIEVGGVDWETGIVAAYHALSRFPFPAVQDPSSEVWRTHHKAFHMALLSACQSEWQLYLANLLFDHAERFRIAHAPKAAKPDETRDTAEEHQQLVNAILERNAAKSTELLKDHYLTTEKRVLEALKPRQV